MPFDALFGPMLVTPGGTALAGDAAWLAAMLRAEAALTEAQASLGLIPRDAADAIVAVCGAGGFGAEAIGAEAVAHATPVVPLVAELRRRVPEGARRYVHFGATSQDIVDTAAMLLAQGAAGHIREQLREAAGRAAALASAHRETPMAARTVMRQAAPTSFGLVAAGWLTALLDAGEEQAALIEALPVQLGGAVGTLGRYEKRGPELVQRFARGLGLVAPRMPWHTRRRPIRQVAAAMIEVVAATEKLALDVLLLSQHEVGELSIEAASGGRSSAMPQKRNPSEAVLLRSAASAGRARAGELLLAGPHEHQRAAGAWQAEWVAFSELLCLAASCAERTSGILGSIQLHPERMLANLEASGGLLFADRVAAELAQGLPGEDGAALTAKLVERALGKGVNFKQLVLEEPGIRAAYGAGTIATWFDPLENLGSARELVDAALARFAGPV